MCTMDVTCPALPSSSSRAYDLSHDVMYRLWLTLSSIGSFGHSFRFFLSLRVGLKSYYESDHEEADMM